MQKARYFKRAERNVVECLLCPHRCMIKPEAWGKCGARFNRNGDLYAWYYGKVSALQIDPIEKKPLYHFHPGKKILSVGSRGCNFDCSFCQNHHISQESTGQGSWYSFQPEDLVDRALHTPGNVGIAFTYNEPLVGFEFVVDTARLAKEKGIRTVIVSNGYINPEPLQELLEFADAFNIDLKAFTEDFYRKTTDGSLQPVLDTIKSIVRSKKHLEITFLVIPSLNDNHEDFQRMVEWILVNTGKDTPLHLSRFFPHYRLMLEPTPRYTLEEFFEIAASQLSFVYPGNIHLDDSAQNTSCPSCNQLIVSRHGYETTVMNANDQGACMTCGTPIFKN